ncbi:hypothetical protein [Amycolatopsis sp. NPDC059657]|uniref:hypothetical protein n=1 Tax=Amycolatopsis sp. NPDC059657 TaxID=3346899 RepID=UPI00366FB3D6
MHDRNYRYYAITDSNYSTEEPVTVVRAWGPEAGIELEESFTINLKWEQSSKLRSISTGSLDYEAVPIDKEAALRFEAFQAERVAKRAQDD